MNTSNTISTDAAFNEFEGVCKSKNLSPSTIRNYNFQWRQFTKWFESDVVSSITQDTITTYVKYLQNKAIEVESINTALRHMRAIVNFYHYQAYCQPIKITLLKTEQKVKDCYTLEELAILLKKPDVKGTSFPEFRTWAAINFLVGTGCRARSLVNVKIQDVDFDNGLVTLTATKNKKQQILPMAESLQQVLKHYLKQRQGVAGDYLFSSESNTRLLESSVYHDIEKYNHSRGVEKVGVHRVRHTFAKNWVLTGGNVFMLQKQLGHSSLIMSQKYANIYDTDLQGTGQFNLLEKMNVSKERITMNTGKTSKSR